MNEEINENTMETIEEVEREIIERENIYNAILKKQLDFEKVLGITRSVPKIILEIKEDIELRKEQLRIMKELNDF